MAEPRPRSPHGPSQDVGFCSAMREHRGALSRGAAPLFSRSFLWYLWVLRGEQAERSDYGRCGTRRALLGNRCKNGQGATYTLTPGARDGERAAGVGKEAQRHKSLGKGVKKKPRLSKERLTDDFYSFPRSCRLDVVWSPS